MSEKREGGLAEEAVQAHRELHPELWEKIDRIARIIDPGAFGEAFDGTGPDAQRIPDTLRLRYMRSRARHQAWQILEYLGHVPQETDWVEIFRQMDKHSAK